MERQHVRAIERHAESEYPAECCGVLLGEHSGDRKRVTVVRPTANANRDEPERRYAIDPEELLAIEKEARASGLDTIGYYHSHPDAPPRPSAVDRAHAWPTASYLIVSVNGGRARSMASWTYQNVDAPFGEEPIVVEEEPTHVD